MASSTRPAPTCRPRSPPAPTRPPGKATTQLDLWGWTGFAWPDYDPGSSFGSCTLGQAGHIEDTVVGFVARAQLETLVWASAATTGVARAAYDPHKYDVLSGLEGTIREGSATASPRCCSRCSAACVGGWLVSRPTAAPRGSRPAERAARPAGRQRRSRRACGPSPSARALDEQITKGVTWVERDDQPDPPDSDPGREIGESLRTNLVEPTWRYGMFGTVDGADARRATEPAAPQRGDQQPGARRSQAPIPSSEGPAEAVDRTVGPGRRARHRPTTSSRPSSRSRTPGRTWCWPGRTTTAGSGRATTGWMVFWGVAAIQWLASVLSIWCLVIVRLIIQAWPAVALLGLIRPRAAVRVFGIAIGAVVADLGRLRRRGGRAGGDARDPLLAVRGRRHRRDRPRRRRRRDLAVGVLAVRPLRARDAAPDQAARDAVHRGPVPRCRSGRRGTGRARRRRRAAGTTDAQALALAEALPAEAAPGREVVPISSRGRLHPCPARRRPPVAHPLIRTRSRRGRPFPPPCRRPPARRPPRLDHVVSPPRRNGRWSLPDGPARRPRGGGDHAVGGR